MAAGNLALCTGHYCFLLREDHTEGLYCTTGEALNLISTLPAETLQPENTDLSSEEAENTAGETE